MKSKIQIFIAGISIFAAFGANAANQTFSDTENVTTGGATFTFNQFNPSLGTLTAIDLIIVTSTLQGDITYTRTSGSRTFSSVTTALSLDPRAGFAAYESTALAYLRSPSGSFIINSGNPNQLLTVTGTTQSLIGGSPVTLSINSFASYIGLSSVTFLSSILLGDENTGSGAFNTNIDNLVSPTSISLRYTYSTDPAPVPEPGQVAASLLLLSGICAYVFIKRRKKSAPASA